MTQRKSQHQNCRKQATLHTWSGLSEMSVAGRLLLEGMPCTILHVAATGRQNNQSAQHSPFQP
jgi:hypothetical protein